MKESSFLFNEHLFHSLFKWLSEHPESDMNDCPLWSFYGLAQYDCFLPVTCNPAMELAKLDENLDFKYPPAREIINKRKYLISRRKMMRAVSHCVYCPIIWPYPWWTGGIIKRDVVLHVGLGMIGTKKFYTPCITKYLFGRGLFLQLASKNLDKKSRIALRISKLPLSEIGERLVSGKYDSYEEVLKSYD